MYTRGFYITEDLGNNAFSFSARKNPQLYVPEIQYITSLDEVFLQDEREKIAFQDYDFQDTMQTCYGLKNFYIYNYRDTSGRKVPCYIFDNHNHAYFFWHYAYHMGIVEKGAKLYHVDEHADMRDPCVYLNQDELRDLENIFHYTQYTLNVGNFIIPAIHDTLLSSVIQLRSQSELDEYFQKNTFSPNKKTCILDVDLDFFHPDLDYISYEQKKTCIRDIANYAGCITICTSPFFISQQRALKVLRDVF